MKQSPKKRDSDKHKPACCQPNPPVSPKGVQAAVHHLTCQHHHLKAAEEHTQFNQDLLQHPLLLPSASALIYTGFIPCI